MARRRRGRVDQQAPARAGGERRGLRRELGAFDFTLLVVGAIVGADVYVVSGLGAQFLGPAQLVSWLVAGMLAALIALAFVQCAAVYPQVGGSYAYARNAFGPFVGFLAGWWLYLGEAVALPVFPIVFANYFGYFLPAEPPPVEVGIKTLLVVSITAINLLGVRKSGLLNDFLTVAKLLPLVLLVLVALAFVALHPGTDRQHLTPFAPLGWGGFGSATVLIFWAYAGFELAVLPAGEVSNPKQTLPRGLITGIAIATAFYVLTALAVVLTLPWQTAAGSTRPLADALAAGLDGLGLPSRWGPAIMSLGALISIAGVYDVFTLGVARLSYALARDGLFPPPFGRVHGKYGTPWAGLAFQAAAGLGLALVLDLSGLIAIAVFFLGVCYVVTALAALALVVRRPGEAFGMPGLRAALLLAALSGAYLASQASRVHLLAGTAATTIGLLVYAVRRQSWRNAGEALTELKENEAAVERWALRREHWLLRSVRRHPRASR